MTLNIRTQKTRLFTVAALAFILALPVAGQGARERSWNRDHSRSVETGATKVIAIQVWADPIGSGQEQRFGIAPDNEAVQVWPGERLRLSLVGTGLFNGKGDEVPVGATFNIEAGRDISILRSSGNWVEVAIGNDARGVAGQVGYRVRGGYDMRGGLTNGRITLEARAGRGDDRHDRGGRHDGDSSSRREQARVVTSALVEGILNTRFDPSRDREWVDRVYENGYRGVQSLSDDLAKSVERRRIAVDADDTVRRLYRVLLRRDANEIKSDRGFWTNVSTLRRDGLRAVVRTVVGSTEFRTAFDINQLEERDSHYSRR
ncbi:MAG TPA: hypothetical protein VGS22_05365 [Thermoanaerobaculia bacterium]|jgi:hypothetical protein|nr:hypothetical protein [Thermoanaerobaculia bacterium]